MQVVLDLNNQKKFDNITIREHSQKNDLINCDLTDKKNCLLNNFKPDIIIHSAAMTDVDLCEKKKKFVEK